jgi:hypothetical protein
VASYSTESVVLWTFGGFCLPWNAAERFGGARLGVALDNTWRLILGLQAAYCGSDVRS